MGKLTRKTVLLRQLLHDRGDGVDRRAGGRHLRRAGRRQAGQALQQAQSAQVQHAREANPVSKGASLVPRGR